MLQRGKLDHLSKLYVLTSILLSLSANAYGYTESYSYDNFKKLQKSDCKAITKKLLQMLPAAWHRYENFVKQCNLNKNNDITTAITIVSIWASEYYDSKPASGAIPADSFPLPIIFYNEIETVGELPELYPENDVVSPNIYFGKWVGDIPTEIRVDVSNPAVEGNYYYPSLLWNDQSKSYEMKSKDVTYGQRPR